MNPIRRELLNGLFVLVVASLLSAAFAAFQVSFNIQLRVLILLSITISLIGYVMFEIALGYMASTEDREKEWLKRVGTQILVFPNSPMYMRFRIKSTPTEPCGTVDWTSGRYHAT